MNNLSSITNSTNLTMSSREIAELCEKDLAHVNRDIRKMLSDLKDDPDLDHVNEAKDSRGYTTEFNLPKDLTITLVAGYNVKIRRRIINRWLELETQPTIDPMKALSDPTIMRGLLLTYTEKVLVLESKVVELAPKAKALDRIATHSEGSFCIRDAAKTLQVKEKVLKQTLVERSWIYRRPMGSGYLAYSDKLKRGLMEHKIIRGERPDGSEWVETQARITAKGMALLSEIFSSELAFG